MTAVNSYRTITISRQFGSGGGEFCRQLASNLAMPLLDRKLAADLAAEMHTSEEIVDIYEKMRYGSQAFALTALGKRYSFLEGELIETRKYIASLRKVMLKLAAVDKIIILGRGGQCILHDHPGCLHLRIVAERSYRLARLHRLPEFSNLNRRKLEKLIDERDAYRAQFTKKHFGRDINDPTLYHLTVNFTLLSTAKALRLVGGLFSGRL